VSRPIISPCPGHAVGFHPPPSALFLILGVGITEETTAVLLGVHLDQPADGRLSRTRHKIRSSIRPPRQLPGFGPVVTRFRTLEKAVG